MSKKHIFFASWLSLTSLTPVAWAQGTSNQAGGFPLAQRIPAGSLVYVGWAGQNVAFDASPWGQMLKDEAAAELLGLAKSMFARSLPPQAQPILQTVFDVGNILWRHPLAVALVELKAPKGPAASGPSSRLGQSMPVISAVLIVDLGKDKDAFDKVLSGITSQMPPEMQRQEGGFTVLATPWKVAFGYVGQTFVLSVGDKTLKTVTSLTRQQSLAADPSFIRVMSAVGPGKAKGKTVAAEAQFGFYVDCDRLAKAIVDLTREPNAEPNEILGSVGKGLRAAGLEKVTSVAVSMRVADDGLYSCMRIASPAPHRGVLGLFTGKQLTADDLAGLPAGANMAGAFKLSLSDLLEQVAATADEITDDGRKGFEKALDDAKKETGVSIKDDVLSSLGDTWAFYVAKADVGAVVMKVTVKDANKLSAALSKLEAYGNKVAKPGTVKFTSQKMGELDVHSVELPSEFAPMMNLGELKPSWCVYKDKLYASLTPGALSAATTKVDKLLVQDRKFALARSYLSGQASCLSFLDAAVVLTDPDRVLTGNAAQLPAEFRDGLRELLPKLGKYYRPEIEAIWADKDGLTIENYGTCPSARLAGGPLTVATIVAVAMPPLNTVRQLAEQAGSMANLGAIGRAIAIYANNNDDSLPPDLQALVADGQNPKLFISPLSGKGYTYIRFKSLPEKPVIIAYDDPANTKFKRVAALMSDFTVMSMDKPTFEKELKKSLALAREQGGQVVAPK